MSVYDELKKSAYRNKYRIAFCGQFNRIRYDELLRGVDSAYNLLHNMGAKNRNIIILLKNSPQLIYLFYGAVKLGAKCIFAHYKTSSGQLINLLTDLNPAAVFVEADEFDRFSVILKKKRVPNIVVNAKTRQANSLAYDQVYILNKLLKDNDFKTSDKPQDYADEIGFWGGAENEHKLNMLSLIDFTELSLQKKVKLNENKRVLFRLMLNYEDALATAHAALTMGCELDLKPDAGDIGIVVDKQFLRPQLQQSLCCGNIIYTKDIERYVKELDDVVDCKCEIVDPKVRITVYHSLNEVEAVKLASSQLARDISKLTQDKLREYGAPFTILFIRVDKKDLTI